MSKATGVAVSGYSADTEILTRRRSWVTIDQLTYFDEVATRTPDGMFTWEHPASITWRRYRGDMIAFQSRTTALLAAPGTPVPHARRMRAMINGKNTERPPEMHVRPAAGLVAYPVPLLATSTWAPEGAAGRITLEASRAYSYGGRLAKKPRDFAASASDFAALMGMYLAEGNTSTGRDSEHGIWIWQNYMGRGYAEYQELLNSILGRPVPWHRNKDGGGWHFANKGLWEYLKGCGAYAWAKTIPREVLDLSPEHLERFWRYYWLGDGTTMNTGSSRKPLDVVSTSSPAMAGHLQEILQKLGGWALIQVIDHGKYPGRKGKTSHLTHRLVRRSGTVAFATKIEAVPYRGMIGNVETGTGPVYVRRNYRPVWAGA